VGIQQRILVVDDHISTCEGLAALILQHEPTAKLFIAHHAQAALEIIHQHRIDAALIDARMPSMSGLELMLLLKQDYPSLKLIGMTSFDEDETIAALLRTGATGILLKRSMSGKEIIYCLQEVLAGRTYYTPEVQTRLAHHGYTFIKSAIRLSKRYQEMLRLLCEGLSTKQVADRLQLSESTIEAYRKEMLRKSNCKNTAELIAFALRNGLL
jgi:DNA-binding NarL/FixJ family response regulator